MELKTVDDLPIRLKRNWFGKLVVQVQETRHHCNDLGGSGYYDEFTTTHWRDARLSDLVLDGLNIGD